MAELSSYHTPSQSLPPAALAATQTTLTPRNKKRTLVTEATEVAGATSESTHLVLKKTPRSHVPRDQLAIEKNHLDRLQRLQHPQHNYDIEHGRREGLGPVRRSSETARLGQLQQKTARGSSFHERTGNTAVEEPAECSFSHPLNCDYERRTESYRQSQTTYPEQQQEGIQSKAASLAHQSRVSSQQQQEMQPSSFGVGVTNSFNSGFVQGISTGLNSPGMTVNLSERNGIGRTTNPSSFTRLGSPSPILSSEVMNSFTNAINSYPNFGDAVNGLSTMYKQEQAQGGGNYEPTRLSNAFLNSFSNSAMSNINLNLPSAQQPQNGNGTSNAMLAPARQSLQHRALNDDFFYTTEFVNERMWKHEYQRNNRNGGMKNIRCFPYCGAKHYSSGFCGESLILKVKTNCTSKEIYAYAEINLANSRDHPISGLPSKSRAGNKNEEKTEVRVGTILNQSEIREKLRTRDNPFKDWWNGDLRETKEVLRSPHARNQSNAHNPDGSANGNKQVERQLAFEFNRTKRGWHYGWVANKYISDSKHVVRTFLFVPLNDNSLQCIYIYDSPKFRLYSRKPKRDSVQMNDLTETARKVKRRATIDSMQPVREVSLKDRRNTRGPSHQMYKQENGIQGRSRSAFISSTNFGFDLDFSKPMKSDFPSDMKSIASASYWDELFMGDPETIVNDLSDNIKSFKGENVFKMLQKLLSLGKDDFNKYLIGKSMKYRGPKHSETNGAPEAQYKEIIALRAFAAFLLSNDEDITAEIQAKMDTMNPFDSKSNSDAGDSGSLTAQENSNPALQPRAGEIFKMAKNKFDKFLSTFNLNVDFYTKFSEHSKELAAMKIMEEKKTDDLEEQFVRNDLMPSYNSYYFPKEKAARSEANYPALEIPLSSVSADRKPTNWVSDREELEEFLKGFEGNWCSTAETLNAYDRMYAEMSIPYALRKCYLCITGNIVISYLANNGVKSETEDKSITGDTASDVRTSCSGEGGEPVPAIISQYNPKLFSTGVIKYTFNGKKKPWPLASPLISTKYDAIAVRAFVKKDEQGIKTMCLEHIYRMHKMLRSLKHINGKEMGGTVKLFEKSFDFDGSVEWTEVLKCSISFTKNGKSELN